MSGICPLIPRTRRGNLYKCAGPTMTMGHLQRFFKRKKTNGRQMPGGWGCARLELTEP